MSAVNEMGPVNRLLNFGCCIGMPDSNGVSLVNRFVVKPIDWMIADDSTHKATQYIWREVIARIWAVTTPVFAAFTVLYHCAAIIVKTPLAALKAAGVKQIPESCSFRAIWDNVQNLGQAAALTVGGGFIAVARPDKIGQFAYPISERKKVPVFGYHEVSNRIEDPWTVSPDTFRSHLQHLYDNDYELCTLKELSEGYKPEDGKKLAVITFDDSHESQYRIKDHRIDPDCAMGIIEEFRMKYRDFRIKATFFVNTSEDPGTCGCKKHKLFADDPDQKRHTIDKLRHIQKQHEIAAHGHLHRRFDQLSKDEIEADLFAFDEEFTELGFNSDGISSFAWPHGMSPSDERRSVIDDRFANVADFGFHAGKEDPARMDRKRVRRLFIGPNTGFKQYAP